MSLTYLVDSHTLLWALSEPAKLSDRARSCLESTGSRIMVSHATIWELSIKVSIGKLSLPKSFFDALPGLGYEKLPIVEEHFSIYRKLPLHHRDPFDRMLIAQAKAGNLCILSCDADIKKYGVHVLW